jgi:hypothetical protein
MTRGSLGREEPRWYESVAEQDAAVHWCDACGQPWLKDSAGWLLPLPPGEEPAPPSDRLTDGRRPAARRRSLEEACPAVLWRPPHPPGGKKTRTRTDYQIPALLTEAPQALSEQPTDAVPPMPQHVWFSPPEERVAANAAWCRTCRSLIDAPLTPAGGPWVLLHRSTRERSLSTWTYPSQKDALHAAAHLVMADLSEDDPVALDLFSDQAHAQVLARYLELRPKIDVFEVAELVPMRANEF